MSLFSVSLCLWHGSNPRELHITGAYAILAGVAENIADSRAEPELTR